MTLDRSLLTLDGSLLTLGRSLSTLDRSILKLVFDTVTIQGGCRCGVFGGGRNSEKSEMKYMVNNNCLFFSSQELDALVSLSRMWAFPFFLGGTGNNDQRQFLMLLVTGHGWVRVDVPDVGGAHLCRIAGVQGLLRTDTATFAV